MRRGARWKTSNSSRVSLIHILILFSHLHPVIPSVLLPQAPPPKPRMYFSSPPYMLTSLPTYSSWFAHLNRMFSDRTPNCSWIEAHVRRFKFTSASKSDSVSHLNNPFLPAFREYFINFYTLKLRNLFLILSCPRDFLPFGPAFCVDVVLIKWYLDPYLTFISADFSTNTAFKQLVFHFSLVRYKTWNLVCFPHFHWKTAVRPI